MERKSVARLLVVLFLVSILSSLFAVGHSSSRLIAKQPFRRWIRRQVHSSISRRPGPNAAPRWR